MNFQLFKEKLILLLLLLLLTACSKSNHNKLNQDDVILAFGDSLTFGSGVNKDQAYPAILAELIQLKVINAGISGETTSQGLKRFQAVLDQYNPALILLLEGGNDILQNQNLSITKQNLAQMIEIAQASNITVVLIGVPEKKLFSDSAKLYDQLAETYHLIYADELLSDLLKTQKYKSDSVHFNAIGYRELAKGIQILLQENQLID